LHEKRLNQILKKFNGKVDITTGFETQDDYIRNKILNKGLSKKAFESKLRLLGSYRIGLTSYVMLKPSPFMDEQWGINEAKQTILYLEEISKKYHVDLNIYLNQTYIAKGSQISKKMHENGFSPPLISSVINIVQFCDQLNIPIYAGLSSEGLEESNETCRLNTPREIQAYRTLINFNKTQDNSIL